MSESRDGRRVLRHVPNALSVLRMLSVPVLLLLAATRRETAFTWLLIAALLTDIADGLVARVFSLQSRLGAQLDSVADTLLLLAAVAGLWAFHRELLVEHGALVALGLALWLLEDLAALLRYGRLSSFHTYTSKVAGNVLGAFIGVLFVFGPVDWLLCLAVGVSVLASLEELALVGLLREWRADVKGLWWVLSERRARSRDP